MRRSRLLRRIAMLGCIGTVGVPATSLAQQGAAQPIVQPENAFAYCRHVGADDDPGPMPDSLMPAFQRAFGPVSVVGVHYRCYRGTVMGCVVGANLNCGKANVSRTSTSGDEWCRANPNDQNIPTAVTGHGTIYTWGCFGKHALPVREVSPVDDRGFETMNWKVLN